ncbi:copper resistance protein CopC [Microbacterium sp. ZW T5_56]|uniref:copper resistance protein CopC n=1 Tax=Microbacterium sp. ZW T5_56 TaxID=3378081 RepID=UPI0038526015
MSAARFSIAVVISTLLCGIAATPAEAADPAGSPAPTMSATTPPDAYAPLRERPPHAGYAASEWRIDAIDRDGLTLGFTVDLLQVNAAVLIVNEVGDAVRVEDPETQGRSVSLRFADEASDGTYDVRWHVVAADGQPMEARFTVTYTAGSDTPAIEYEPVPADVPSASPRVNDRTAPSIAAQAVPEPGLDARPALWAAGGGVLGLLGITLWRRRRSSTSSNTETGEAS